MSGCFFFFLYFLFYFEVWSRLSLVPHQESLIMSITCISSSAQLALIGSSCVPLPECFNSPALLLPLLDHCLWFLFYPGQAEPSQVWVF